MELEHSFRPPASPSRREKQAGKAASRWFWFKHQPSCRRPRPRPMIPQKHQRLAGHVTMVLLLESDGGCRFNSTVEAACLPGDADTDCRRGNRTFHDVRTRLPPTPSQLFGIQNKRNKRRTTGTQIPKIVSNFFRLDFFPGSVAASGTIGQSAKVPLASLTVDLLKPNFGSPGWSPLVPGFEEDQLSPGGDQLSPGGPHAQEACACSSPHPPVGGAIYPPRGSKEQLLVVS